MLFFKKKTNQRNKNEMYSKVNAQLERLGRAYRIEPSLSARDGKAYECTVLRDVHFAERLTERCVVYSFDWMNGDMKQIVCFFDSIWRQFQCGTAENC